LKLSLICLGDRMNRCVCCGIPIPYGQLMCWVCEHRYELEEIGDQECSNNESD
jgi:hypothetical protein